MVITMVKSMARLGGLKGERADGPALDFRLPIQVPLLGPDGCRGRWWRAVVDH